MIRARALVRNFFFSYATDRGVRRGKERSYCSCDSMRAHVGVLYKNRRKQKTKLTTNRSFQARLEIDFFHKQMKCLTAVDFKGLRAPPIDCCALLSKQRASGHKQESKYFNSNSNAKANRNGSRSHTGVESGRLNEGNLGVCGKVLNCCPGLKRGDGERVIK